MFEHCAHIQATLVTTLFDFFFSIHTIKMYSKSTYIFI